MNKTDFKGSVMLNPVPVVLVTSKNKEGKVNVFTVAWAGTVCTKPPMISISIRPERLSHEYISETREFVINLPSSKLVKRVDFCGVKSGKNIDKIKHLGFTLNEGINVSVPSIAECPVNIECKVKDIIPLGSHDLFTAEVVLNRVDDNLLDEKGKIHFEKADLVAYSHGEYFTLAKKPLGKFGYSVRKKR
ncbi:flavin reductase family protein [Clostridium polynesiense]|uniref:flavin reductase family protein n=1 Tax=Clostridium polynesiense TaxID=1325933 RepID=UPI00058CF786|nr:flavin reductase family protein [Clostridium polynesiense]